MSPKRKLRPVSDLSQQVLGLIASDVLLHRVFLRLDLRVENGQWVCQCDLVGGYCHGTKMPCKSPFWKSNLGPYLFPRAGMT